jgi:hypothetical protein
MTAFNLSFRTIFSSIREAEGKKIDPESGLVADRKTINRIPGSRCARPGMTIEENPSCP